MPPVWNAKRMLNVLWYMIFYFGDHYINHVLWVALLFMSQDKRVIIINIVRGPDVRGPDVRMHSPQQAG